MLVATQGHEFSQIILKIDREPSPCRTFESCARISRLASSKFFLSESCYNAYNGLQWQIDSPSVKGAVFPGSPWKLSNLDSGQKLSSQLTPYTVVPYYGMTA